MLKDLKFGSKIAVIICGMMILGVGLMGFLGYQLTETTTVNQYRKTLESHNQLKALQIASLFNNQSNWLEALETNWQAAYTSEGAFPTMESIKGCLPKYTFTNLMLINKQGVIVSALDESTQGNLISDPTGGILSSLSKNKFVSPAYQKGSLHVYALGKAIQTEEGAFFIIAEADATPLFNIVQNNEQLGETGESILVYKHNNKVYYNSPLQAENVKTAVNIDHENVQHILSAIAGQQATGFQVDYRNKPVLATWERINESPLAIITKIDRTEIAQHTAKLIWQFIAAGIAVLLIALIITTIFSRIITKALNRLRVTLQLVGNGILPEKIENSSADEIGMMAQDVSHLVNGLKRTASFASNIGKGQFDSAFEPLSDKDSLGNSLINMRDNIQEAEARDRERNQIVHGLAEISEILRSHDELDHLGNEIVQFICGKIDAIQGAFYTVEKENEQTDAEAEVLMRASFAYNRKKYLKSRFKFAEGLVGQAVAEKDIILRTEIPYDYVTVTSGLLGDQRPSSILIVPLITEENVYGVLEFASFKNFSPSDVKFLQEISVIIARTISNIKVNATTRRLLEESRSMSNELQEKQEILQQNAEEMQATQEELERTNAQLNEQIEEVNRGQRQMQLLLENASEVITIYERNGNIKYISPSVQRIFGYTPEELIGRSDRQFVLEHYRDDIAQVFEQLIAQPTENRNLQFEYQRKDGTTIWLEATGNNLLNDKAINGLLFNFRDITERRRAEQEERMRSKMQSLSENSPDLITRFNADKKVFYINPTIEQYTGKQPEVFDQKSFDEAQLPENITAQYDQIIDEVIGLGKQIATEINFPSDQLGERIMQLRGIPEFDDEEQIESVLVVSHDITERKQIEMEVKNQHKKITESINYAKRIQWAIVPDAQVLETHLPESMLFYKAKDVVSGDFPWYAEVGDDVYIAAVDCTGHGVPGALISLIGYFLLNDIVKSQKVSDPGKILDLLDEGVTTTLRQDRGDSMSKDGMDLALLKINKKTNKVAFAGAHRSLYKVHQGVLEEIKGNKFAIGGGKYRNQTDFTTHELTMEKDDLLVFCSDGYPDQFGGPMNRKFGPKRLRELIQSNYNLPMPQMQQAFEDAWEDWKGEYKQTDDVLLIGIRF